jgi:antitoxin HicB
MRYASPYTVKPERDGRLFISFSDIPEALTDAETRGDAQRRAEDVLVTALSFYTDAGRPLPLPSPARGRPLASVAVVPALKLALHEAMLGRKLSNVALAKMLGTDEKSIRRMRDPLLATKVENLEAALRTLGRRAEVTVVDQAAA